MPPSMHHGDAVKLYSTAESALHDLAQPGDAMIGFHCSPMTSAAQVKVFSLHPDGIISVKFKAPDAAMQCIKTMAGRFFGGRQVEAHLWDGTTKYGGKVKETAEEQAARLEAFTASIETNGQEAAAD